MEKSSSLQLPEQLEPASIELDEEDQHELLFDCHNFLSEVLDRKNPKQLQNEGLKILSRLSEVLAWYKLH